MKKHIRDKLERLKADTQKIYQSIEGLTEKQLSDQAYGWNILQVMEHLNSSETLSLVYMKKKMKAGDKMKDAGVGNNMRMLLTNQLLRTKLKWGAPSYIAKPEFSTLDGVKEKWAKTRKSIEDYVDQYPEQWLNKLVYKHPMGGRQNLENAVNSFLYHQVHHMHQINRIRKKIGA